MSETRAIANLEQEETALPQYTKWDDFVDFLIDRKVELSLTIASLIGMVVIVLMGFPGINSPVFDKINTSTSRIDFTVVDFAGTKWVLFAICLAIFLVAFYMLFDFSMVSTTSFLSVASTMLIFMGLFVWVQGSVSLEVETATDKWISNSTGATDVDYTTKELFSSEVKFSVNDSEYYILRDKDAEKPINFKLVESK